ncbi:MAG: cobalt transporter CbiM [bacterium]
MHIPDGYLGPQTYVPLYAVMAGFWTVGIRKLKNSLRMRQVPLLAMGAAFSFVIMMFNVPIPGGTTGHAVGAVLVAILLGPWAAMVAVSLALIVQALIFGDGGISAIGANCFNMAVVMPFVGWWVYRLITGSSPVQSTRRWIGGAIAGYSGLCVAAAITGFEVGLQPMLAHDALGHALFAPFGLQIAVPAMALEHLLVFGFVEAVVTGLVVAYFQKTAPEMIVPSVKVISDKKKMPLIQRIAIFMGILILLAPLGIYLPAKFNAGSAWGEWSSNEIKTEIAKETGGEGYVPQGIAQAEEHGWKAPFPDYNLPGQENAPLSKLMSIYILMGAIGVIISGFIVMFGKQLFAKKDDDDTTSVDA